jgi:hypothetical protein
MPRSQRLPVGTERISGGSLLDRDIQPNAQRVDVPAGISDGLFRVTLIGRKIEANAHVALQTGVARSTRLPAHGVTAKTGLTAERISVSARRSRHCSRPTGSGDRPMIVASVGGELYVSAIENTGIRMRTTGSNRQDRCAPYQTSARRRERRVVWIEGQINRAEETASKTCRPWMDNDRTAAWPIRLILREQTAHRSEARPRRPHARVAVIPRSVPAVEVECTRTTEPSVITNENECPLRRDRPDVSRLLRFVFCNDSDTG